eukprot:CAMPEP_0202468814 /NCGR_PEP_ID=MMETSP1360-20130828/76518_1 /ASSEMBLY_ACC=CAM_ASM_000848 /TAXON_ID=515479 /ORGANISM="Licmophora paradoxa, Strain CCMP2313" /LENGTH=81 /DNA_ID=CAMNT_0049093911 /DNA_START=17 /DNA_END=262 /DNA_ORIENTATION=+
METVNFDAYTERVCFHSSVEHAHIHKGDVIELELSYGPLIAGKEEFPVVSGSAVPVVITEYLQRVFGSEIRKEGFDLTARG